MSSARASSWTEQVQRKLDGTVGHDEAGQTTSARHQCRTTRCAGQERANLVDVTRVVEHDEDPAGGQQAAVQPGLRLHVGGNSLVMHPECLQEAPHGLPRRNRDIARIETPQIDVELAVREPPSVPVRPVHGERRLPHTAGSGDGRDGHAVSASSSDPGSSSSSAASSRVRPVNDRDAEGNWRGTVVCAGPEDDLAVRGATGRASSPASIC